MTIFDIHFLNPIFIYILPIILVMFIYLYFYINRKNKLDFLFIEDIKKVFGSFNLLFYIEGLLLVFIITIFFLLFANPHKVNVEQKVKKNGIDIVFAFDVSGSMEARDIYPSRLDGAKQVIVQFLDKLKTDRVGLVVFAGRPYSSIPLTFDYNILKETFTTLNTDILNQRTSELNGTAIGDAILMAGNLFKDKDVSSPLAQSDATSPLAPSDATSPLAPSDATSPLAPLLSGEGDYGREKVIVLMTDGDATKGVDPLLAARGAERDGIKIYTIGVGSKQGYMDQMYRIPPMNDENLKEISKITSGKFYRVTDNSTLKTVFKDLEKLEKNDIEIKIKKSYKEYYNPFLYMLIFLFLIFIGFRTIFFRR